MEGEEPKRNGNGVSAMNRIRNLLMAINYIAEDGRTEVPEVRQEFEEIWYNSGRYPGRAIARRWPRLTDTTARNIARHWGLPEPRQMAPVKSRQKKPIEVTHISDRIWEDYEPRIKHMMDEAHTVRIDHIADRFWELFQPKIQEMIDKALADRNDGAIRAWRNDRYGNAPQPPLS